MSYRETSRHPQLGFLGGERFPDFLRLGGPSFGKNPKAKRRLAVGAFLDFQTWNETHIEKTFAGFRVFFSRVFGGERF